MHQVSPHQLWIGHAGDGRAARHLIDAGIRAVVQLAIEEPVITVPRELVYCRFPLQDGTGNDLPLVELSIRTVTSLIQRQIPTLVCCSGGMSRSPAIAAAALSAALNADLDECLKTVIGSGAADVSPGLWRDVMLSRA